MHKIDAEHIDAFFDWQGYADLVRGDPSEEAEDDPEGCWVLLNEGTVHHRFPVVIPNVEWGLSLVAVTRTVRDALTYGLDVDGPAQWFHEVGEITAWDGVTETGVLLSLTRRRFGQ